MATLWRILVALSLLTFVDASDINAFVAFTNNCTDAVLISRRRPTPVEHIYWLKTRSTYILSISTTANNTFTAGPEGLTEAVFIGGRFHPLQYGLSVERGFDIGMQIMPVNTFSYKIRTPLTCTNATCAGSKEGVPLTSMTEVDQLASNFEITLCPDD